MHFYWLRDRKKQGQYHIFWHPGATNQADYFSKHHPASHHQAVCPTYLHSPPSSATNYYACLVDHPGEGVLIPQVPQPGPITIVATSDLPHRPGQSHQCHSCVSQSHQCHSCVSHSHNAIHVQHSLNCGILWECHYSPLLQNLSCHIHSQSQSPNCS